MIQHSDRKISTHVWVSYAAYYKSPAQRARIDSQAALIERAMPVFYELLHIPRYVSIRIAGLKARTLRGKYVHTEKTAELSHKLANDRLLTTLAHELIHAEQYNTGKLKNEWSDCGWVHSWEGDINTNKGTTYQAYRNQPWEIEAFGREQIVADVVRQRLGL